VGESDCQTIRERLDLYLDNELLVETNQSVLDHISSCPTCAGEDDECKGEDFTRRRIQLALERERRTHITASIRWAVLAASLILATVIGLAYWRIGGTSRQMNPSAISTPISQQPPLIAAVDRDAVENHQVCALSYPPGWTFDRQRVARDLTPRFAPLIDAVDRKHASYELVEGHICSYQQRQYAHLIFRGNGHTVSVFIENDAPGGKRKSSRPLEIDQATYETYQVASVDTGLHHIFVVSDLPGVQNRALANQLFPATLGFIQKLELNAG